MARKKIREFASKRLLRENAKRLAGLELEQLAKVVQVQVPKEGGLSEGYWEELAQREQWLTTHKLVAKPDMLFGKRGKNDLVGLNLDLQGVVRFVDKWANKEVEVDGCLGTVTTFIVEPFVEHDVEYYLCIQSERLGNAISFSDTGGIDIEENWSKVKKVFLPTGSPLSEESVAPLVSQATADLRPKLFTFIRTCYAVFEDLDFTLMEMNPFTFDSEGNPFPLDMRGQLDDTASFRNTKKWSGIDFPLPFGRNMTDIEGRVHALDETSGSSLKLSVLNPQGRIWTMVAGGGASVIYSDTVADLGGAEELGNYAEYSGAPSAEETYQFAKSVIECATSKPDGKGRALIVGGGIANFTDVNVTFNGIIRAMREMQEQMRNAKMHVYVRRGGPNFKLGLENMKKLGVEIGVPFEVCGPESSMTGICANAIEHVQPCTGLET